MTALQTRAATTDAPVAGVRIALALGRVEGRRLLRHPAFLAGVLMSVLFLFVVQEAIGATRDVPMMVWAGVGPFPLAAGTFLASFTATIRSRRHGTDELYATQPAADAVRTGGHLVSVAWAVAACCVLLAAAAVRHELWDGVSVAMSEGVSMVGITWVELLLGPLVVAVLGLAAVAVGRWVPSMLAMPVAAVVLLVHLVTGSWGVGGGSRWFLPLVTHEVAEGWVQVEPNYGYSIVESFQRTALAWHELYLVGVAAVIVAAALLRHGRTPARLLTLALGTVVAVVAGVLQLP